MLKPTIAASLFLLLAAAASAQSVSNAEYGRASGGEINVATNHGGNDISGSLSIGKSSGGGSPFGASAGGTLMRDRIWFFASAEKGDTIFARRSSTDLAPVTSLTDAKVESRLSDRQSLSASFAAIGRTASGRTADAAQPLTLTAPSSFLSLHYTGIISDRMFVTGSVREFRVAR